MEIFSLSLIVAGSIPSTTIQAAVDMAFRNPRAAVWIPANYFGTDTYSNPHGIPIFDMRGTGSISFGGGSGVSERLVLSSATALTSSNFVLSGWGSGATITAVHGSDGAHYFTITAGTSPSTEPTIQLVFADGAWAFAPVVVVGLASVSGVAMMTDVQVSSTTTSYTATLDDTPAPSGVYNFRAILVGPIS